MTNMSVYKAELSDVMQDVMTQLSGTKISSSDLVEFSIKLRRLASMSERMAGELKSEEDAERAGMNV